MAELFEVMPARAQQEPERNHFHHWDTPDGDITARFFRIPDGYLIRFPHRADFNIRLSAQTVSCVPAPGVSQETVAFLYHNQILPLVRSSLGELVLHGSAVAVADRALAFVGPSGRGKSTLAAAFARAGYPFVTDDGLWLERDDCGYLAMPNRSGVRLWADSRGVILEGAAADLNARCEKEYVEAGPDLPFQETPLPLGALYLLDDARPEEVTFSRLTPRDAVSELIRYCFILDIEDAAGLRGLFDRLIPLAERVPCFALSYPRRYGELPRLTEAIIAHAAGGDAVP